MVTDELIRSRFVSYTLQQGIGKIYSIQQQVNDKYLHQRTGDLNRMLRAHSYTSEITGGEHKIFIRIYPYLRFLDMSYRSHNDRISKYKRRNYAIYNRVVWGVFYNETVPELQHGFTDEVRLRIRSYLEGLLLRYNKEEK